MLQANVTTRSSARTGILSSKYHDSHPWKHLSPRSTSVSAPDLACSSFRRPSQFSYFHVDSRWPSVPPESTASLGSLTAAPRRQLTPASEDEEEEVSAKSSAKLSPEGDQHTPLTLKESVALHAGKVKSQLHAEDTDSRLILADMKESLTGFFKVLCNPGEKWDTGLKVRTGGPLEIAKSWRLKDLEKKMLEDPFLH
ncbi:uncharacterized protein LOC129581351 [Paramacrobiotus metropolitanus]|uniref:uncharacterized protein LOC129581351 n=1 Tax=Paramacrobiotus metropolitanus TaxID=2943436 RepID=UPI0024460236|nr:uncharacterized protein LOC129581351 [Paramacrobiotus metropolitanus]